MGRKKKPGGNLGAKSRTTRLTPVGAQYLADRLGALRSLDRARIIAYADRYGVSINTGSDAQSLLIFWGSVHKARLAMLEMTEEEKNVSRLWLIEHGFRFDLTGRSLA